MLDLAAEREHQDAERIGRDHRSRCHRESPTHVLGNGWHSRAPVAAPTAGRMTRQEPRPDQKDDEEERKRPEAKGGAGPAPHLAPPAPPEQPPPPRRPLL